jgi:hypothetical protein
MGMISEKSDPTFLTFSVDFSFNNDGISASTGLPESPLFNLKLDSPYSAYTYLKRKGFVPEAERLKTFVSLLKHITEKEPWYFQAISGLDKLWKNNTNIAAGRKDIDAIVGIETLETLDMKITYLADLYRNIVYDTVYLRELLPRNLRYFMMDVYVAEFRNFKSVTESLIYNRVIGSKEFEKLASGALDSLSASFDTFQKNSSFLKFECRMCEFDFTGSMPTPRERLSVHEVDMASNNFNINVGWMNERNSYKFFETLTKNYPDKYNKEVYNEKHKTSINDIVGIGVQVFQAAKSLSGNVQDITNFF